MNSLIRYFVKKSNQCWILIGFGIALFTICCAATSNAKIDPEAVAGIWLFDEGNGKITEDLSGNGNDGELMEGRKDV